MLSKEKKGRHPDVGCNINITKIIYNTSISPIRGRLNIKVPFGDAETRIKTDNIADCSRPSRIHFLVTSRYGKNECLYIIFYPRWA